MYNKYVYFYFSLSLKTRPQHRWRPGECSGLSSGFFLQTFFKHTQWKRIEFYNLVHNKKVEMHVQVVVFLSVITSAHNCNNCKSYTQCSFCSFVFLCVKARKNDWSLREWEGCRGLHSKNLVRKKVEDAYILVHPIWSCVWGLVWNNNHAYPSTLPN